MKLVWKWVYDYMYTEVTYKIGEAASGIGANELEFWKSLGDELLFRYKIDTLYNIPAIIYSVQSSVHELKKDVHNKWESDIEDHMVDYEVPPYDKFLTFKMTCWTAEIPVINSEIPVKVKSGSKIVETCGHSMDVGFRLTKYSSIFETCISMELAYILLYISMKKEQDPSHRSEFSMWGFGSVFFSSMMELKGVEHPYPILWIKTKVSRPKWEIIPPMQIKFSSIEKYFQELIKLAGDSNLYVCKPYFYNNVTDEFEMNEFPKEHEDEFIRDFEKSYSLLELAQSDIDNKKRSKKIDFDSLEAFLNDHLNN